MHPAALSRSARWSVVWSLLGAMGCNPDSTVKALDDGGAGIEQGDASPDDDAPPNDGVEDDEPPPPDDDATDDDATDDEPLDDDTTDDDTTDDDLVDDDATQDDSVDDDASDDDVLVDDAGTGDDEPSASDAGIGGGYIEALILHSGTERRLVGPDVNPDFGLVSPEGYTVADLVFDLRNRSFALSGEGTRVWVRLMALFPEEGVPPVELWALNTDGSYAARAGLPDASLTNGLHLRTTRDGADCYANDTAASAMYRASFGGDAEPLFDYTDLADFDLNFGVSGNGQQMFLGNLGRFVGLASLLKVDLGASPVLPTEHIPNGNLALEGIAPRGLLNGSFDVAEAAPVTLFQTNHDSTDLDPRTQNVTYLNDGFTSTALREVRRDALASSPTELQINDLGDRIAYCEPPEDGSINGVNRCVISDLTDELSYVVSDERSRIGRLVMSDDGSTVYYRSDVSFGSGFGVLQSSEGGTPRPAGSRTFFNTTGYDTVQLDDSGSTLLATLGDVLYVLQDGASAPANFPALEHVYYRFEEDCRLTVRALTRDLTETGRVSIEAYYLGVEPTAHAERIDNPLFSIRAYSELMPLQGASNDREITFALTNSSGECAVQSLSSAYRLRVIAHDPDKGVTTFEDFQLTDRPEDPLSR